MTYVRKNNRPGLSPEFIRGQYAKGNGPTEIAEALGCSRQAVSDMATRHGIYWDAVRRTVHENMPWSVPREFRNEVAYRYLLAHARYVETGGIEELSKEQVRRLRSFYRRLLRDDSVLEFRPDTGFEFHPREASDNNLVIRVNEFAKPLTPEGKFIWARPTTVP